MKEQNRFVQNEIEEKLLNIQQTAKELDDDCLRFQSDLHQYYRNFDELRSSWRGNSADQFFSFAEDSLCEQKQEMLRDVNQKNEELCVAYKRYLLEMEEIERAQGEHDHGTQNIDDRNE